MKQSSATAAHSESASLVHSDLLIAWTSGPPIAAHILHTETPYTQQHPFPFLMCVAYSGLEQFFSHTARFQSANRTMLAVLNQNEDALLEDAVRVGTGPHTQTKAGAP